MGNKEGFSSFGMSEKKIRQMQDKISKEVEERQAETERLLSERKSGISGSPPSMLV